MTPVLALLALLGCDDPALAPFTASLDAWDEGRAALESGRPADAVTAFAAARAKDPGSTALRLWEAKALADAGRLDDADARLGELLQADPASAAGWYNRAAYRARAGHFAESASDLSHALSLGARSPLEAADDPDFAVARADPAFAGVLPAQPLEASARGPDGAVFVGSRAPVELVVSTLPTAAVRLVRDGADPRCVRLMRVLEDDTLSPGRTERAVTADLRADGPCTATLGPFTVSAGPAKLSLAAVPLVVEGPPGAVAPADLPPLPTEIPLPSAYAPADAGFAGQRVADGVVALGRPGDAITGNGRKPDVTLEWRVDGQTRAVGGWWREPGPVELHAGTWALTVP